MVLDLIILFFAAAFILLLGFALLRFFSRQSNLKASGQAIDIIHMKHVSPRDKIVAVKYRRKEYLMVLHGSGRSTLLDAIDIDDTIKPELETESGENDPTA
jgi:flagellar biogenesis protein FliO